MTPHLQHVDVGCISTLKKHELQSKADRRLLVKYKMKYKMHSPAGTPANNNVYRAFAPSKQINTRAVSLDYYRYVVYIGGHDTLSAACTGTEFPGTLGTTGRGMLPLDPRLRTCRMPQHNAVMSESPARWCHACKV